MNRLLVVRLGSLGDLVHTLPAVASLRRAHPSLEIDWLVDAPHREFLSLVPCLSQIHTLRDRTASAWLSARGVLRAREYDVAVDFQGLIKSAALARLSGARRVLGFDRAAAREGAAALFYTTRAEVGEHGHVIDKNLRLAAELGATSGPLEFPLRDVESPAVRSVHESVAGRYALVNPGAAWPNKRWPAERYGQVAAHLRHQHGLVPVVLWGPAERQLAQDVVAASGGTATIAPETTLSDLVGLARGARLMVSGDTGPLHIAAATGVPVVALFGPTSAVRNGPWVTADMSLGEYADCECHYERRCRRDASRWCLGQVAATTVMEAIDRRLAEREASA